MLQVLLALEIVIAIALVGVILLQRSEGGALGMGGGGSGAGFGGFMSARGASNLLTRATAILATLFIGMALLLSVLAGQRGDDTSVFDASQENADLSAPLSEDLPALDESTDDSQDALPPVSEPEDDGGQTGDTN